jgi:AcrR family transcriptional regulator
LHRRAGGEACERCGIHLLLVDDALQVADGAAVVEGDEAVVAEGAHPAGHGYGGVGEGLVVEGELDGVHGGQSVSRLRSITRSENEIPADERGCKGTMAAVNEAILHYRPPPKWKAQVRTPETFPIRNVSDAKSFPMFAPRMEAREADIIDQSAKVFMRLGIRSVNMDDVAQQLRISKKTLYQFVTDKNDLVTRIVRHITTHHRTCIAAICGQGHNVIDENFEITRFVAEQVGQMHPSIHFDLEKYHPKAWDLLNKTERKDILECVTSNMKKGVAEGMYRDDVDIDVVARIYISRFDACFDGELFPANKYRFDKVIWELFRYHTRGIASDKGLKYLTKKVKNELPGK